MSNPWAQSFDDLRRPYLEEKKDRDGDGKVESDSKEHAGLVHNAIQRAKGGKPDGKDTRKEAFTMAADPEKRAIPRPTKKAEDKKGKSVRSRAIKAVGTQRRQDKEVGISGTKKEETEFAGNYEGPLYAPWTKVEEGKKKGLWDNIHAKRKRGEKPAKKGDKDYPKTLNVENQQVDEDLAGMVDKATKAGQAGLEKIGVKINRTPRSTARPSRKASEVMRQNKMSNEEKEHAEKVELQGEAYTITNADVKGNTPAYRNYKSGMKSKTTGKPLYNLAPHVKMADSVELEGEMTEANAGPSTPVANYDGKIMPNSGAGRVGKVRLKPGVRMADSVEVEGDAIEEGSMKAARKNVGASTCWKGYKAKGTKMKGGKTVPNCVKEHSDWREEMGEGFFSEAAKRQQSLDIKTSGVKNKVEINPELKTEGACSDKPMERLKTDRDGYRVPQKDADAAKARIMAKTKKKREQAKENIMKGPLLPGEGRKVYPKGAAPKATGAKLPLANSYNPMLDSVEEQALQMIERTRFAKEKGTDSQTGKESKKGGKKPSGAFAAVSAGLRKSGGMMSSRGKAIAPQGKKKEKGAKGPKGVTPVDKIKGQLAKKRAPKPNPYKARAGESD